VIQLNLYPLGGLSDPYSGFYTASSGPASMTACGKKSLKGANSLFWAQQFAKEKLGSLVNDLQTRYRYTDCNVPGYVEVLENPDRFLDRVTKAPEILAAITVSEQSFFSAAETLTILCHLYSDFVYWPFRLTIDHGFLLNEVDTSYLIQNSLNSKTNPYYEFIVEYCLPVIAALKPQMLWLLSPIRFSNFSMAMLARKQFPNVHICAVDQLTEYYSLNKIRKYLRLNKLLFSVIDSIILDDAEYTRQQMLRCIEDGDSLDKVPNLIYIDRSRDEILETPFKISTKKTPYVIIKNDDNLPEKAATANSINHPKIADIKMWPDAKCYWNRCTFCGINHKYNTLPKQNRYENIDEKVNIISQLVAKGCQYFWLVDEAVPPKVLEKLAKRLTKHNLEIYWQARSRIDRGFSQKICQTLAKSGLREIRLGLESANRRILKLMDKFPEDFDLGLVEKIVGRFHQSDVSVRLCAMIGFPTETPNERKETFDFLYALKKKYSSLTFNVNKFMLDVTSKINTDYGKFDITSLKWPCPARCFLGNIIGWDSSSEHYDSKGLDIQRNSFMRQTLYPWMSSNIMIQPLEFYELCEAFRKTLRWKSQVF
jgi:hypothetical protein